MKKLVASTLTLTAFSVLVTNLVSAAGNFDEAYWEGYCNVNNSAKLNPPVNIKDPNVGFLFKVIDGKTAVDICCPQNQLPTGNVGGNQQRCALFGAARGDCKTGTEIAYCTGNSPFKVCCPDGQAPTCDPDSTKQQCAQNPFGKITDSTACLPADEASQWYVSADSDGAGGSAGGTTTSTAGAL